MAILKAVGDVFPTIISWIRSVAESPLVPTISAITIMVLTKQLIKTITRR